MRRRNFSRGGVSTVLTTLFLDPPLGFICLVQDWNLDGKPDDGSRGLVLRPDSTRRRTEVREHFLPEHSRAYLPKHRHQPVVPSPLSR